MLDDFSRYIVTLEAAHTLSPRSHHLLPDHIIVYPDNSGDRTYE